MDRVRRGSSIRRLKTAPDPEFLDPIFSTEPPVTGAPDDAAASGSSSSSRSRVAVESKQEQPAPPGSASSPLPEIQRGLRASRIVPVRDAENALNGWPRRPPEEGTATSLFLENTVNDRRRVYPSEGLPTKAGQGFQALPGKADGDGDGSGGGGGGGGGGSGDGSGGDSERRAVEKKSRRISELPALTNLDLSSSLTATSSTSTLPPLELEVVALPSLPPTPSSPTNGRTKIVPGGQSQSERADNPEEGGGNNLPDLTPAAIAEVAATATATKNDEVESNLTAETAERTNVVADSEVNTQGDTAEESGSPAEAMAAGAEAAEAAAAVAAEAEAEAAKADLRTNISLGWRHAQEIRDRLRRTFSPQGVEVTTVMVCSAELPSHIAEQMSGRTLNASLAEEHRAVKRSESQRVRHEGDVLGLRQRWQIEKDLVLREGEREIAKVCMYRIGCGTCVCCACVRVCSRTLGA